MITSAGIDKQRESMKHLVLAVPMGASLFAILYVDEDKYPRKRKHLFLKS